LDDDGYLRRDLQSISNDLLFLYNIDTSPQEIEEVLKIIQTFDPPGVGARNLQECLYIQIQRKLKQYPDSRSLQLANIIIEKYFEDYSKKHFDKLLFKLNISEEELRQADEEITHLNPRPGWLSSSEKTMSVIPDFIVNIVDGKPELSLNNALIPELTISKEYIEMLNEYSRQKNKELKEASKFIKTKIEEAKWFIDALQQRERILLTAMYAIMEYQKEFFITGDTGKLKPLLLRDIAEKIDADVSTVSRIVNSKYVMTPYGTYPLKFFFSESIQKDSGEEVSNKEIKHFIQEAIQYENKKRPLTDDQLCELLTKKGYNIARRTVAKYREQLGIPVARLRKEI
jgi:RNA polymerase sigma-54 factor